MTACPTAPGPLALVGSGEYLPEMAALDGELLAGRPARFVQLATAAVPDGPAVVARWHALGRTQAERLGVRATILPVATRADARDPEIVAAVAGAGLIYLSGGHPGFLADTLRATPLWAAIVAAWRAGAALAGCSAGAMALAARVPAVRTPAETAGLALLPHLRVIPHYDAFAARRPELVARLRTGDEPGVTVVGIDELTALVGGPEHFRVEGRGAAWILADRSAIRCGAGTSVTIPTTGADGAAPRQRSGNVASAEEECGIGTAAVRPDRRADA